MGRMFWEPFSQLIQTLAELGGYNRDYDKLLENDGELMRELAMVVMGAAEIVHHDPVTMLSKCRSDAVLVRTVNEMDNECFRMHAVPRLFDSTFTFPKASMAIVERIGDQRTLLRVALEGADEEARAATSKLKSVRHLEKVALNSEQLRAVLVAIHKLPPEKVSLVLEHHGGIRKTTAPAILYACIGCTDDKGLLAQVLDSDLTSPNHEVARKRLKELSGR